jgi:GNAT superfamily N-acetyltransferase
MLHVRTAEAADMPVILGFIAEAAGWLAEKGTDQWAEPWPDEERRDERVARGIRDRCTWMVEDDGEPVATISCRPQGNRKLWKRAERSDLAVYVSRLIVRRSHAGLGIGNELFDWAGKWAAAQYDARWIRIDVWTTNKMLHEYYEKRGFRFMRRCTAVDYPSAALFEKDTADITDADVTRLLEVPDLTKPAGWRQRSALTARSAGQRVAKQLAGVAALQAAWLVTLLHRRDRDHTGAAGPR